ncbi:accessory Sec system protein translocase subunit SecY2 [Lactococcus garvieae]
MKEYYGTIRRILWTVLFIVVILLGSRISLPGVELKEPTAYSFLQLFANVTGGNSKNLTLFTLGLGPYMISLILWGTLSMLDLDRINNLTSRQIGMVQRILTLVFSTLQASAMVLHFKDQINYSGVTILSFKLIYTPLILLLATGGMIVSYIADMNAKNGVGRQMIIILPSLIANIPAMLLGKSGKSIFMTPTGLIILGGITLVFIYISVIVYRAEYRVEIEQTGMDITFENTYIPLKIVSAGALPFMFGVTLFSIPQLFIMIPSLQNTIVLYYITQLFSYTTIPGIIMYGVVITLLSYGFSHVNVRVYDIAKGLRDTGDYILGVAPGEDTEKYLRKKLNGTIILGNFYMLSVSIIPLIIGLFIPDVTNLAFYFGSIFMLIIIIIGLNEDIRFMFAKRRYNLL